MMRDNEKNINVQIDKIIKELESQKCEILLKSDFDYGIKVDLLDPFFKQETVLFYNTKGQIKLVYNQSNDFLKSILLESLSMHQVLLEIDNVKYVGIDESGKGDYLGPLVIAGMISDSQMDKDLIKMGVQDCKTLSDKRVLELATDIKKKFKNKYTILPFEPHHYNKQYAILKTQGLNMTELLKVGQCEVIKRLLDREHLINGIIADSISHFDNELSNQISFGRKLLVLHEKNAERNPAVAAAGILARAYFLNWLSEKSLVYKVAFPKGADSKVICSCLKLMQSNQPDILKDIAKLHFKTTQKLMEKYTQKGGE